MTLSEVKEVEQFKLDGRLAESTVNIGSLKLCQVLLSDNSLFPWLILVPKRSNVFEIIDLDEQDRYVLMDEISFISGVIREVYSPDKLNVAALGNQVKQLHIHVIARYENDNAWPNPVWGAGIKQYTPERLRESVDILKLRIGKH